MYLSLSNLKVLMTSIIHRQVADNRRTYVTIVRQRRTTYTRVIMLENVIVENWFAVRTV